MLFLLSACSAVDDGEPSGGNIVVGDALPHFVVTMNDGQVVSTDQLLGSPSVVVFFSVDCPDCQRELPEIQRLWDMQLGIPIVPIARENSADAISAFWQKARLTMPYSPQSDRTVYALFASSRIPRIYISNSLGVVCYSHDDTDMPTADRLAAEVKALCQQ